MARKTPEINSSSQADIAFLLLCFFLMTTSMDVDYGITRRLPPPVEQNDEDVKVKERNVMNVMVNKSDRLLVNGRPMDISLLKDEAKRFMTPRPGDETAPEVETKTFDLVGDVLMSKGVISLQNDRGTSYRAYIAVQNELVKAINELRDEFSYRTYGRAFLSLPDEQQDIVKKIIPQNISEAEPKDVGKRR
jgi:biopolymer transport protein ExbD